MRALTVIPLNPETLAVLDMPEPPADDNLIQVDAVAVGVCGTDREIARGDYGWAPPGQDRLILGHESLGRVRSAPANSGFANGDLVVGVVRRPDPVPCAPCGRGEFDQCRNGLYTERGIKQIHGYASQRWSIEPEYAVKLDPSLSGVGMLMEPTTVVTKAWRRVDEVSSVTRLEPKSALITGAGPIGLLAALIGVLRGLDVHVLDRDTAGAKPMAAKSVGAEYHSDPVEEVIERVKPDVVIEATGAAPVVVAAAKGIPAGGVVCLTGVAGPAEIPVDVGELNNHLVLGNGIVVGSVNANLGDYHAAARVLASADLDWLNGLITRRIPLEKALDGFTKQPDDIKVALTF